ncbi:isoprenylcysteine carboxylmethyltransferase family protein [Plantactinospora veratri]|uniref:Isoprenylcysteine carboxylmethyltransferase family protein n=1 Tax=Plantactinospora veratri TaxID=1436122 RepID=A0ABU7SP19_9ACTN
MTTVRYLCLLVPVALTLGAARLERGREARFAALLAFVAAAVGIAALTELARPTGWYAFAPVDGTFRGMPVDLWLGWALLWGPIPVLLRGVLPLPVALGLLCWLDAVAMPQLRPLVHLGPSWLVGEAVGLLCVALPAQLLGRWSADRRRLPARVLLQLVVFTALVLWLLPTVVFEFGDGSWDRLLRLPATSLFVLAQLGLLLAVPALAAVREFAVRGGGTPYPWDPPRRLVTTGPYGYVGNPMQVSVVGLLLLLAVATGSGWLAVAALAGVAFGAGVAGPHERRDLDDRYGPDWRRYRAQVRDWWPRWRPYPSDGPTARLWLDGDCGPCAAVGAFLDRCAPRRLLLRPAAEHDRPLRRAGYADGDGYQERGVAAVARALDHVTLGWAYLGWLLRLPGVAWLAQLVTDAMIAPPHLTRPRGEECPTPSSDSSTGPSPPSARTASPGYPPGPSPAPPG